MRITAGFQFGKYFVGPVDKFGRHTGHACHMNTETVCASSWSKLAEEYDLVPYFFIGDVEVPDAAEFIFQFVQFMIVRGKKCLGLERRFMQVFGNTPGDGDTIVSRSTPADLIKQYQTSLREVVDDAGCFIHFHHERTFPAAEVIGGAHPGKYLVGQRYPGGLCGNKAAHMSHQGDKRRLPQDGALTAHIGSGQDDDLLVAVVQDNIVADI